MLGERGDVLAPAAVNFLQCATASRDGSGLQGKCRATSTPLLPVLLRVHSARGESHEFHDVAPWAFGRADRRNSSESVRNWAAASIRARLLP